MRKSEMPKVKAVEAQVNQRWKWKVGLCHCAGLLYAGGPPHLASGGRAADQDKGATVEQDNFKQQQLDSAASPIVEVLFHQSCSKSVSFH